MLDFEIRRMGLSLDRLAAVALEVDEGFEPSEFADEDDDERLDGLDGGMDRFRESGPGSRANVHGTPSAEVKKSATSEDVYVCTPMWLPQMLCSRNSDNPLVQVEMSV